MSYRFVDSLQAGSGRNCHSVLILLASCQQTWNCLKHVEFYSKNKFEKLVDLSDFIIRNYQDAQSPERQKRVALNTVMNFHLIFMIHKTLVVEHPSSICPISHTQLHTLLMSDPHIKRHQN